MPAQTTSPWSEAAGSLPLPPPDQVWIPVSSLQEALEGLNLLQDAIRREGRSPAASEEDTV